MAKRTDWVVLGLAVVLAVVLLAGIRVLFWLWLRFPSHRAVPIKKGDAIAWQGGSVSVWDYSYDFGGYDNRVEWTGPGGKRQVLTRAGDSPVDLEVLPDGRLEARHSDEKRTRVITLTWRDRHYPPSKVELNR